MLLGFNSVSIVLVAKNENRGLMNTSWSSILSRCKTLKCLQQFHAHVAKIGLDSDPFVAGKLLLNCGVHVPGSLEYARLVLNRFPRADTFMYNTMIRSLSDSGSPEKAISLFSAMLGNMCSIAIDSFSLAFTLKAAADMRRWRTGAELHCQAVVRGLDTHLFVGTTLISMYGECGCAMFAKKVFDEIPDPNVVTWNAMVTAFLRSCDVSSAEKVFNLIPDRNLTSYNLMLAGYTKMGKLDLGRKLFQVMPNRDDVSWSTMIAGFLHNGCFDEALVYFKELLKLGMRPNEVSLTAVLCACAQTGALEFSKILHGFIEKAGLFSITPVCNAMTDAYSRCGRVDMASLIFDRMLGKKNIISWTSMIVGLAIQGHGEETLKLFHEMEASGIRPDSVAFIAVLYGCSHAGLVEQGLELFNRMTRVYNIKPDIEHYGCIVDLYGRTGQLLKAYDFVLQMPIPPSPVIWRTLLGACSFHGNVNLAEKVKKKLSEIDPYDSGDHVLMSNIYATARKWEEVAAVRKSMTDLNISKTPGWSMIEVNKVMYTFVASSKPDSLTKEVYDKLDDIMQKLKTKFGYIPETSNILHDIEDEEKEDAVTVHSEKLALAFGMARIGESRTIRIVKNLRVCRDCHSVMILVSQAYEMEILLRDRSRFHTFNNGICSCNGYW